MPNLSITAIQGRSPEQKQKLLHAAAKAMTEGFGYTGTGLSVRIIELPRENCLLPPNRTEGYLLVQLVCFPGRTLEQRKRFYTVMAKELEAIGENSQECLMMIQDLPLESWGMAGGKCAVDLF